MVGPMITGDHPVLTKSGYKKVEDLTEDDVLAIGEPHPNKTLSSIILGSLLGDASISSKSAQYVETHSTKQRDYVLFKQKCLRHFGCKYDEFVSGGLEKSRIATKAFRFFAKERKKFYPAGKKVAWAVGLLSDLAIAVWYMDDGNLAQHGNRSPSMSFATNSFSAEEVDYLCEILERDVGIGDARRVWSNGWRIRVGFRGTKVLAGRIAKFIIPSLRYKLPKSFRGTPYVDVSEKCEAVNCHWEPRPIVEEMTCSDKSFYCLDVEKNHNFITTGGIVVHNCYTPGNRKPFDSEKDNCRVFLDKEVALLQPKVIVALGSMALKQLTGMSGMMKNHGQSIVSIRYKVPVIPVLHPSPLNLSNPIRRREFYQDLWKLKEVLDELSGEQQPESQVGNTQPREAI
jgi:uracil-DNA glycosylase family 4